VCVCVVLTVCVTALCRVTQRLIADRKHVARLSTLGSTSLLGSLSLLGTSQKRTVSSLSLFSLSLSQLPWMDRWMDGCGCLSQGVMVLTDFYNNFSVGNFSTKYFLKS
jgi:hypothetical protein